MTKTINFKYGELVPVANFMAGLDLVNKASRARTKLIKLIAEKNEEYNEDENDAVKDFYEDGTLIKGKENEVLAIKNEMRVEVCVLDLTEYIPKMVDLRNALDNYSETFADSDAILYDLIMDQLETISEDEMEETK